MRWTAAALIRPATFVLSIVVAVLVGNATDSFWYGLLAWLVAMALGRVVGAVVRNLPGRAIRKLVWPVAATAYAFLFDALGIPPWATFFVTIIAASLTRQALEPVLPGRRWPSAEWRRIDLDELLP
jgi:hypothetical protein